MSEPALRVEVPANVNKRDQARIALQRVQPIFHPWILRDVGLALQPDVNSVATVKQHGEKYRAPLDDQAEWNRLQVLRYLVVLLRADQRAAVRPKMLCQKRSNGK